tara:strand:- start:188 stop:994 length:807 start_codon:yes stop_codon:yes gene_type:complete
MKIYMLLLILLLTSCIDLIVQEINYNSLFFSGGSWIELQKMNSMSIDPSADKFSLQFWISGGEVDTNEAPALFSLITSSGNIILSLLRDPNVSNRITTIINSQVDYIDVNNIDFSDEDNFYLISLIFSNNSNVKVYIDSTKIISSDQNNLINFDDEMLIVGAIANEQRTIIENFWYGYIDEIRLWNTHLSDSVITYHTKYANKLGDHYRYTDINGNEIPSYLDSLIGIWRLNFTQPQIIANDDSGFNNNGSIYTLSGYSIELSKKGAE